MLGVTGIVVCLAGILGVWFVASRLQRFNSKLFGKVDQLVTQVERRADQARNAVGETRDLVDELKKTLRDSATDRVAERVASLPEIDNLERWLASAMERADGLVQRSTAAAELIEQSLVAFADFASERHIDLRRSTELMASIQSVRDSLGNASESLSEVQSRLAELRQNRQTQDNRPQIMKLSLGIVAKLDVVQSQMDAVVGRLNETKIRLGHLQNTIRSWIFWGQILFLLLVAWAGAGQYCLLVYGWRILRPSRVG
jgi:chromosome segregation ATPase